MVELFVDDVPKYIEKGYDNKDWYKECEEILERIFGGNRFLAAEMLAATSINTSLKSNIKLFKKAWHQYHHNIPFVGYMPNIQKQLQQIKEGTGITGQKIQAFKNAMSGDHNAVVVDVWISRIFKVNTRYIRKKGTDQEREREGGISASVFSGGRTIRTK